MYNYYFVCSVLYILFSLCCSMYCLCVNVYCTTATGVNPIAVNKYIISYHSPRHKRDTYPTAGRTFLFPVASSPPSALSNIALQLLPPYDNFYMI